ncbi:MAG: hypothetical protein ABSC04_20285 [Syntrophobacteraceae bacterium]|jgi:hypothetical protein
MKVKSTLVIVCLALALLMTVGTTPAQAQPCGPDGCCAALWVVYTPFILAGGAVMLMGAIVTAPFSLGCGCNNCGCALLKDFPCCLFPKCGNP